MSTTAEILRQAPLFALMDDEERAALGERMRERCITKGETIFSYGDAGSSLVIVRTGRIQAYVESTEGDKIILGQFEPGQVVGEISLFDPGPRSATAVAVEHTDLLELDHEELWQVLQRKPHIALDMLAILGKRLRATDELLRTHVSRNLNIEEEERLTFGEHIADRVAAFGGSWTFIIAFAVVLTSWMGINAYVLATHPFDPYPFILLNLVLSALAALQAPVIMMSQNRQATKDRLKADLDYQVNLKAELEVAQLHGKIDRIYGTMQAHFARLEKQNTMAKGADS